MSESRYSKIELPDSILGRFFYDIDMALGITGAIRFTKWAAPTALAAATIIAPTAVAKKALEATAFVGDAAVSGAGYLANKTVESAPYVAGKAAEGASYVAGKALEGAGYAAGYVAKNAPAYIATKALQGTALVGDAAIAGAKYTGNAAIEGAGYVAKNAPAYIATKALEATAFVGDAAIAGAKYAGNAAIEGAKYAASEAVEAVKRNSETIAVVAGLATVAYMSYIIYNNSMASENQRISSDLENEQKNMKIKFQEFRTALNSDETRDKGFFTRLDVLCNQVVGTYEKKGEIDQQKVEAIKNMIETKLKDQGLSAEKIEEISNKTIELIASVTSCDRLQQAKASFAERVTTERAEKSTGARDTK